MNEAATMRAFSASDAACVLYPDDTPEHRLARAAYIKGAADTAPAVSGEGWTFEELNLLRQWFNSIEDTNPKYLQQQDRKLFAKITTALSKGRARHSPASPSVEEWQKAKGRVAHWIERLAAGIDSDPDITFERIESELQSAGIIPAAPKPEGDKG